MNEEKSQKMAAWLAKEKLMIKQLSSVNPAHAAEYAQANLELLQNFFSAPADVRHVFINL